MQVLIGYKIKDYEDEIVIEGRTQYEIEEYTKREMDKRGVKFPNWWIKDTIER